MKEFGPDDFLGLDVFVSLNAEFLQIEAARRAVGRPVQLVQLDLSAGMATVPTAAFINIIERNLDRLAGAGRPAQMEATKTWLGEDRDAAWLDYRDVNRWFASLAVLRQM